MTVGDECEYCVLCNWQTKLTIRTNNKVNKQIYLLIHCTLKPSNIILSPQQSWFLSLNLSDAHDPSQSAINVMEVEKGSANDVTHDHLNQSDAQEPSQPAMNEMEVDEEMKSNSSQDIDEDSVTDESPTKFCTIPAVKNSSLVVSTTS